MLPEVTKLNLERRSEILAFDTRVVGGEPKFQLQFPLTERRPIIALSYVPKQSDHLGFPCAGQCRKYSLENHLQMVASKQRLDFIPSSTESGVNCLRYIHYFFR